MLIQHQKPLKWWWIHLAMNKMPFDLHFNPICSSIECLSCSSLCHRLQISLVEVNYIALYYQKRNTSFFLIYKDYVNLLLGFYFYTHTHFSLGNAYIPKIWLHFFRGPQLFYEMVISFSLTDRWVSKMNQGEIRVCTKTI